MAVAAACVGPGVQIGFAALAIGPLGLPHPSAAMALAGLLQVAAIVAAGIVLVGIARRWVTPKDVVTLAAMAAMVALPPLVGFAVGFVMLHAARQARERQNALGCGTMAGYLARIAPVLVGAAIVLVGVAILFVSRPAGDVGLLFAGIAALAMPHILVTPFWHGDSPRAMRGPPDVAAVRL